MDVSSAKYTCNFSRKTCSRADFFVKYFRPSQGEASIYGCKSGSAVVLRRTCRRPSESKEMDRNVRPVESGRYTEMVGQERRSARCVSRCAGTQRCEHQVARGNAANQR